MKTQKIEITKKQMDQFNRMRLALKEIASYETPEQIKKFSRKAYGLDWEEAMEMAYENMQNTAKMYIKGVKQLTNNKTVLTNDK